jgi:iron complex transport system substrate-binding protein
MPTAAAEATATPAPTATSEPTPTLTPEPPAEPAARVLVDSIGREVELPATVDRIVSLAPSATEILFAIGAGDRIVGTDDFSDYPPEAADIEKVGSLTPDLERVVALQPDLVLGSKITSANPDLIDKLESAGVPVWIVDSLDVQGVPDSIAALGEAIGLGEAAAAVAAELAGRIEAVMERVAGVEPRPRVFHELDASDPSKPFTVGPGNFVHDLITLAGGENVFADAPTDFPQVSFEEILSRDPQVIILADAPYGVTVEAVKVRTGWGAIDAVVNDRILALTQELGDQISRPGPRIADGLDAIARFLHPEQFE